MFFAFFIIAGASIFQFILSCLEKFRDRKRLAAATVMILTSACIGAWPAGMIDFEAFAGKDLVLAEREGAANCMTTLRLKDDGTFQERSVCFGVSQTTGRYTIVGDTAFFTHISLGRGEDSFEQFAVIRRTKPYDHIDGKHYLGYLTKYKDREDTVGLELWLMKDQISVSSLPYFMSS